MIRNCYELNTLDSDKKCMNQYISMLIFYSIAPLIAMKHTLQ
jgi:hypothetical protein